MANAIEQAAEQGRVEGERRVAAMSKTRKLNRPFWWLQAGEESAYKIEERLDKAGVEVTDETLSAQVKAYNDALYTRVVELLGPCPVK